MEIIHGQDFCTSEGHHISWVLREDEGSEGSESITQTRTRFKLHFLFVKITLNAREYMKESVNSFFTFLSRRVNSNI